MQFLDWYPMHPQKFNQGTAGMTLAERGAYITLLNHQWCQPNGHLPKDHKRLALMCSVGVEEFEKIWSQLSSKFPLKKLGYRNQVLHIERLKANRITGVRRESGRLGGLAKAKNLLEQKAIPKRVSVSVPVIGSSKEKKKLRHDYLDDWNRIAKSEGWRTVRQLTTARRRHLHARESETGWDWAAILVELAEIDRGFVAGGRRWWCFDWLIKNEENYVKLLERSYRPTPEVGAATDVDGDVIDFEKYNATTERDDATH